MTKHQTIPPSFSAEDALVAIMVAVSVADQKISNNELVSIEQIIGYLPVFSDYDADRVRTISRTVFDLLEEEDGLDALFGLVRSSLPVAFHETAYALACDVAAADGALRDTELRMLEEVRHELEIDRLHAAAIERGARARHLKLPSET